MEVINHILLDVDVMFKNVAHNTLEDMDKVQSTIKQIVRDWSCAGAEERAKCYDPLLAALDSLHPENTHLVKVLVPGSGLGRLAWEIARALNSLLCTCCLAATSCSTRPSRSGPCSQQ